MKYRNGKQIDIDQFCKDVSESPTLNNIQGTVNELVGRYNLGLLDKHAPIIHRVETVRIHATWNTESLRDEKRRTPHEQTAATSTRTGQCSTCYKSDKMIYIDNAYPK